ncbi:MAG TPA: trehalose-binding protein [Desulfonatronum sp.]|nr:trehalose-binding protein [Desulfonatronum sp.]
MQIGPYSPEEFSEVVLRFHGYTAPGVILGGYMVEAARRALPENILFDALSETTHCLPDAIQLLTPCTTGNSWLKVVNLGRYALCLYDKYKGDGVRVFLDPTKMDNWEHIADWYLKRKPKKEQDTPALMAQIHAAGAEVCGMQEVQVAPSYLRDKIRGGMGICPLCQEAYPLADGAICRGCQGEAPYTEELRLSSPELKSVPAHEAVGRTALHDMTEIVPGKSKGPIFLHGQEITVGDVCRLQQMGRSNVYLQEEASVPGDQWLHEDKAARSFAQSMAGPGSRVSNAPREGKMNLYAEHDGMLLVDETRLEAFNSVPGVMCASRHNHVLVKKGMPLAGTRSIPLYLPREYFLKAMAVLNDMPLFEVRALKKARVGVLVTGTEVFQGLVEDKFIPIISSKVQALGSRIVQTTIVPDDREAITKAVRELLEGGVDLIITTAGLSVDPDDVTRLGLEDAGAADLLYGAPILPGAMTLLARIGAVPVLGVPACALYFKTTSLDLLLPRLLAGVQITRADLARMGLGSFCLECLTCTFPKCPFGK